MGQLGLTYRGLYGEGSRIVGNFFQVSNQTTLGKTEEDLIDQLEGLVGRVIGYEKKARSVLLREAPSVLEDKVWRAYGILSSARSLPFEEMMNLLSGIRLGVSLKLLKGPRVETISRVMIHAQTAHLERAARRRLDETDADVFRATYVREALSADGGSAELRPA
jgi:protein arginine kinase